MIVVYSDRMVAPAQGSSPSAAKPRPVVEAWRRRWPTLEILPPVPVHREDFYRAHDPAFVDDIFALKIVNGFGTRSNDVLRSLPYTSGAMLTAARIAMRAGTAVAAPVSGFHHAGWQEAEAYCTFNGLMVTALALRAELGRIRVGILDYDYHYGNGTDDIIRHLNLDFVVHVTAGREFVDPGQANRFLRAIPEHLARFARCDVVLYQAGADPHVDDPLGGFLTSAELAERDRLVFSGLKARGIPVAWNLAGGYQQPLSKVVAIHERTMAECLLVHEPGLPPDARPGQGLPTRGG